MEINGKELKSKEENHNVQGIPHTESKSSGPSHLPKHQRATGWREFKEFSLPLLSPRGIYRRAAATSLPVMFAVSLLKLLLLQSV